MGEFTDQRYSISLLISGYDHVWKLSNSNDATLSGSSLEWADMISNNLAEPNPYSCVGSVGATMSIPSGFNDWFDFAVISGQSGFETSGYLYSGWQDFGYTSYSTYESIWTDQNHLTSTISGNIGFVCSSLYNWTQEIPSGIWKIRYIDDETRFID